MHIHILGIAGTFMSSLAILAKSLGFTVTGQDQNIYPPMSNQLSYAGIDFIEGYDVNDLPSTADLIVVGNVMRRGMPIIEYILDNNRAFISGPNFLSKFILKKSHVLVVTGTHGKTTTTSMLAWILHYAGLNPGYLVGGMPKNFNQSANIGQGKYFVIEGDEYDCAFFDKRSKFIHYNPKTLIINNIEFDHADIFENISDIIKQFHYLIRLVPSCGSIIFNETDPNINKLLNLGSWSKLKTFNPSLIPQSFNNLSLIGEHNLSNANAACMAAMDIGVKEEVAIEAMQHFNGVARRLEYRGCYKGINIYDDFAHHPTAIKLTIKTLLAIINKQSSLNKKQRLIAVVDLGSNTLKLGSNNLELIKSVQQADQLYLYANHNKIAWDLDLFFKQINKPGKVCTDLNTLINALNNNLTTGDNVVFMSNGSLATALDRLQAALII